MAGFLQMDGDSSCIAPSGKFSGVCSLLGSASAPLPFRFVPIKEAGLQLLGLL